MFKWVNSQNAKGLSPPGPAIYEKLMEVHPARRHSDVEPLAHMSQQGRRCARHWLLRLRKRVRLVRGRFKPGPALSQEAMRKKACAHNWMMMWSRMGRDHAQKHLPVWILFWERGCSSFRYHAFNVVEQISCPENGYRFSDL